MAEVLVVGGGPAGLAAAAAARERGADVVLVEAGDAVGGQYWRHLPPARPASREALLHHGWRHFERLRARLDGDPRCRVLTGAHVWAVEPTREGPTAGTGAGTGAPTVHVLLGEPDGSGRRRVALRPDGVVLATGAHDRTLPFPGWDLPGVVTGGAAQALAKGERVAVGRRVLVAGAGPFLLPVAASLLRTGATVVEVVEASRLPRLARGWLSRPWQLLPAGAKVAELAGYAGAQLRHRVPYRTGAGVVAAHGDGGDGAVWAVTVAALDDAWAPVPGTERVVEVDAVCVTHGFSPRLELAVAAGCALTPAGFVAVDDAQLSSAAAVHAAGEVTGIGGVDLALAEGTVAGHCAAGGAPGDAALRGAVARRGAAARFAARLGAAHGIGAAWTRWLDEETVVCRCEEVTLGRLRTTAALTQSVGLRSLKLSTRAGLGICQGRVCGQSVGEILEQALASTAPAPRRLVDGEPSRRPIAVPIRLGELAAPAVELPDLPDPDQPSTHLPEPDQPSTHPGGPA